MGNRKIRVCGGVLYLGAHCFPSGGYEVTVYCAGSEGRCNWEEKEIPDCNDPEEIIQAVQDHDEFAASVNA